MHKEKEGVLDSHSLCIFFCHIREYTDSASLYTFPLLLMLHEMEQAEMERLLTEQYHGHLGYTDGTEPTVVPISYAFQDGVIYGYTHEGHKISALRENPRACLQVDEIAPDCWRSVIVHGDFTELEGDDRVQAVQVLGHKIAHPARRTLPFLRTEMIGDGISKEHRPIIYRIKITSMTGRTFGQAEKDV